MGKRATKGLSEDGSTRSWRTVRAAKRREAIRNGTYKCPGKPPHSKGPLQLDHTKSRRKGGTDAPSNLGSWYCARHNPGTGRPRKGT